MDGILALCRERRPRVFGKLTDEEAMSALGIVGTGDDGKSHPTLAGLLVAGNYPQQFLPRVNITFTCYPGYDKVFAGGVKFIDNYSLDGPIPEILEETLNATQKNMRIGGVLTAHSAKTPLNTQRTPYVRPWSMPSCIATIRRWPGAAKFRSTCTRTALKC